MSAEGHLAVLEASAPPACESPHHDAKETAIAGMKPKPHPSAMHVSDVVQSPLSSLDGELEVPAATDIVARAGTGFDE